MPLKNFTTIPPGGYFYEQKNADGAALKVFKTMSLPFKPFCRDIQKMREANGLPRPTIAEVLVDVEEAQCERLNFDPLWCQKKTGGFSYLSRPPKKASEAVVLVASRFYSNRKES